VRGLRFLRSVFLELVGFAIPADEAAGREVEDHLEAGCFIDEATEGGADVVVRVVRLFLGLGAAVEEPAAVIVGARVIALAEAEELGVLGDAL